MLNGEFRGANSFGSISCIGHIHSKLSGSENTEKEGAHPDVAFSRSPEESTNSRSKTSGRTLPTFVEAWPDLKRWRTAWRSPARRLPVPAALKKWLHRETSFLSIAPRQPLTRCFTALSAFMVQRLAAIGASRGSVAAERSAELTAAARDLQLPCLPVRVNA